LPPRPAVLKMPSIFANQRNWIARHRHSALVHYAGAALAVWVALSFWTFSSLLQRHSTTVFLAAVLFTARYLGFGPAIFSSFLSAACLDFFVLPPAYSAGLSHSVDIERLVVFLAISVFAGSMARQKTLAETRAGQTTRDMAALVESSRDAIYSTSPLGTITSWNRAAERLYGYTAEEALGMSVAELAPPERRGEVQHNLEILTAGGHVEPYRTERWRKDETRWPVLLSVSPLLDASGHIVGTSAIARDISAEKKSEDALRRREKLATAGRLAASIAHEINNPLEAVVNLLYLARNDASRANEYLTMAEREVGRVARIAQQTLGFVRDSSASGTVDPAAIMDEVLQLYSHKLLARQIRVARRYRAADPIRANGGELRQLFSNLVVNATDAMGKDGSLHVRVTPSHEWADGRDGIRITVADNGRGIPPENLLHIFDPFYTTKRDTGTGLGLWISSGIVREHGGSINVRSRVDGHAKGTVFSVFLPYHYEAIRVA
jgi:PAS domain S-box-containing protein